MDCSYDQKQKRQTILVNSPSEEDQGTRSFVQFLFMEYPEAALASSIGEQTIQVLSF